MEYLMKYLYGQSDGKTQNPNPQANEAKSKAEKTTPQKKCPWHRKTETEKRTVTAEEKAALAANALLQSQSAAIDNARIYGARSTAVGITTGLILGYLAKRCTEYQTFSLPLSGAFLGAAIGAGSIRLEKPDVTLLSKSNLEADGEMNKKINQSVIRGAVSVGALWGGAVLGAYAWITHLSLLKIDLSDLLTYQSSEAFYGLSPLNKYTITIIPTILLETALGAIAGVVATTAGMVISTRAQLKST